MKHPVVYLVVSHYYRSGLATLTTCLSLIQEAAAASARRALGMNKEKVAKDNIIYIDRRPDIRVGEASENAKRNPLILI